MLLTAGLAVSAVYLKQTHHVYFTGDPYAVYSIILWLVYLGLVVLRWRFAQRGRRFALGAIGTFVFLMLTFWGVFMLSGLHHPGATP